eukprot:1664908-Alexandrium_andersonii.AAC.1
MDDRDQADVLAPIGPDSGNITQQGCRLALLPSVLQRSAAGCQGRVSTPSTRGLGQRAAGRFSVVRCPADRSHAGNSGRDAGEGD